MMRVKLRAPNEGCPNRWVTEVSTNPTTMVPVGVVTATESMVIYMLLRKAVMAIMVVLGDAYPRRLEGRLRRRVEDGRTWGRCGLRKEGGDLA